MCILIGVTLWLVVCRALAACRRFLSLVFIGRRGEEEEKEKKKLVGGSAVWLHTILRCVCDHWTRRTLGLNWLWGRAINEARTRNPLAAFNRCCISLQIDNQLKTSLYRGAATLSLSLCVHHNEIMLARVQIDAILFVLSWAFFFVCVCVCVCVCGFYVYLDIGINVGQSCFHGRKMLILLLGTNKPPRNCVLNQSTPSSACGSAAPAPAPPPAPPPLPAPLSPAIMDANMTPC